MSQSYLVPTNFTMECVFLIRHLVFAVFLKKINKARALINMQNREKERKREKKSSWGGGKVCQKENRWWTTVQRVRRKRKEAKRKVREERLNPQKSLYLPLVNQSKIKMNRRIKYITSNFIFRSLKWNGHPNPSCSRIQKGCFQRSC